MPNLSSLKIACTCETENSQIIDTVLLKALTDYQFTVNYDPETIALTLTVPAISHVCMCRLCLHTGYMASLVEKRRKFI